MICKKRGVDMGDGKGIKYCFQWGGPVSETETEKILKKGKDKNYRRRLCGDTWEMQGGCGGRWKLLCGRWII